MTEKQKAKKTGGKRKPDVNVFIAEYKIDRNGRRAAVAAGYSEKTAAAQASRLLTNVKIRAEVDSHRQQALEQVKQDTGISLERTLKEIARIAYFDPRRMFDKDGAPLAITELDDDTAAVIAGLDVLEENVGNGEERVLRGYVKKWKLSDKRASLDMLMKHLGGYEVDNQQKQPVIIQATRHDETL